MNAPHVLVPGSIASRIAGCGSYWGVLDLRIDEREDLVVVSGFSKAEKARYGMPTPWLQRHYSRYADSYHGVALWHQVKEGLNHLGQEGARRSASIKTQYFRDQVMSGWRIVPRDGTVFILTFERHENAGATWAGWWVSHENATWVPVEVVDEESDLFDFLKPGWPVEGLSGSHITILGTGSIGGAAAEALASYALRRLTLVDPDRLHQHNFARHRTHRSELGRLKVNAVADRLLERDPRMEVERMPLDVAIHADVMRPLFQRTNLVIGCTDGVASRRVISHLAVRARVPFVLACVLEDGAYGELLRIAPGRTGCLSCHRAHLVSTGSMDPEPGLDLGYGTRSRHQPMTAVGGDLSLVGELAAKMAIATLLEARGDWGQRLAGDWAIVGLRPVPDLAPPFDIDRVGEVRWGDVGPSRPSCPSCGIKP